MSVRKAKKRGKAELSCVAFKLDPTGALWRRIKAQYYREGRAVLDDYFRRLYDEVKLP